VGLKQAFSDILRGVANSIGPQAPKKLRLSQKCFKEMEKLELTVEDIRDVFYHGRYKTSKQGTPMASKLYPDYEVGMTYRVEGQSGDYLATFVWKNPRR